MDKIRNSLMSGPPKEPQEIAMFLAMVIRTHIEDFHCKYLSDEQMSELNPIIRNSIYTGLQSLEQYDHSDSAKIYVKTLKAFTPDYWETPELLQEFQNGHNLKNELNGID